MPKTQMYDRLNAMFNTVIDGIITIDDKGMIDSINPSAEKLFCYQSHEVIGQNINMLMAEPHSSKHDQYIKNYLTSGETKVIGKSRKLMGRRKNGSQFPFRLGVSEMRVDNKRMFTGVIHDLSDNNKQTQLLEAITEAQTSLSLRKDYKKLFDRLLEQLLLLTESEYGFIGEVHKDENEQLFLKTHAITNISWNKETSDFYQQGMADGLEFRNLNSLFGSVMLTAEVVIANTPSADPRRCGLPDGHPPLNAFLGLPFFDGDNMIGMVGVANRQSGYDEKLVNMLQPFMVTCSNILVSLNNDKKRKAYEVSLWESEARGRAILEGAVEAIITIDKGGIIEDMNPATKTIFGYTPDEIVGQNVKMLMPEPYSSQHDGYLHAYLSTGKAKVIGSGREVTGMRKDGTTFPMELAVNHITVGGRDLFTGVIRDISEQKESAEQLKSLNNDLSQKLNQLAEINQVNESLNEMGTFFQLSENVQELNKVLLKYCQKLFDQEAGAFFKTVNKTLLEQEVSWGNPHMEQDFLASSCWALRRGEAYEISMTSESLTCNHLGDALEKDKLDYSLCIPVLGRDGAIGLLSIYGRKKEGMFTDFSFRDTRMSRNRRVLSDISDRFGTAIANISLRQKLHLESTVDPLTKLYNRRFFEESSELEMRRSKRMEKSLSILMIDADHFKSFNDEYGHDAGDYILQTIADIMRAHTRSEDIPTRLGGEEFAVLFSMHSTKQALIKAEKIRQAVEQTELVFAGKKLRGITISGGVSTIPEDADDIQTCLSYADKALYSAKNNGRNKIVKAGDIREKLSSELK